MLSHQAPGWRLEPTGNGGLRWIVPGGWTSLLTYPPGYGTDDDLPPTTAQPTPVPPALAPPALAPPATPTGAAGAPDDDPPPF